jgi:enoyl reductase-like protein
MRKEGLPIEGFCVAAGIPSTEKAVEIVDGLRHSQLLTLMDEMKARLNVVALAVTHRVFSS